MSVKNWDGLDWFLTAIATLIVLSFGVCVTEHALETLDKRSCRQRGGAVEETVLDWRCVGGRQP